MSFSRKTGIQTNQKKKKSSENSKCQARMGRYQENICMKHTVSCPAPVPPHLSQAGKGRSISEVAWPLTSPPEHTKLSVTGQTGWEKKSRIQVKLATNKDKDWGKSPLRKEQSPTLRAEVTRQESFPFPSIQQQLEAAPSPCQAGMQQGPQAPTPVSQIGCFFTFLRRKLSNSEKAAFHSE